MHSSDATIWSDLLLSWACAALCENQCFQVGWREFDEFSEASIAARVILPILVVAAIWGQECVGSTVMCNSDNEVVVAVLQFRVSKRKEIGPHVEMLAL